MVEVILMFIFSNSKICFIYLGSIKRYKSNWYAYRYMKFMDNGGNPRKRNNTVIYGYLIFAFAAK